MDRNSLKVLFEESKKYAEKFLLAIRRNPGSIIIIDNKILYNPCIRISGKGVFLDDLDSNEVLDLFYNTIEDLPHSMIYKDRDMSSPQKNVESIDYFFKVRLKIYSVIPIY
jgi:hypothetical protein